LLSLFLLLGRPLQKSPRLHHFKSDRDEIWQDCSSSKYASIYGVGFLIWYHTFKMMSFHAKSTAIWRVRAACHTCSSIPHGKMIAVKMVSHSSWSTVHSYWFSQSAKFPHFPVTAQVRPDPDKLSQIIIEDCYSSIVYKLNVNPDAKLSVKVLKELQKTHRTFQILDFAQYTKRCHRCYCHNEPIGQCIHGEADAPKSWGIHQVHVVPKHTGC